MPAPSSSWIISEGLVGLQAQALGLAEAAGLDPELRVLEPRPPWRWTPAAHLARAARGGAAACLSAPWPDLLIGCGGVAAAVGAGMRRRGKAVVQVQNPRMDPRKFDIVVVNRHDELSGPNVVVTRTALHRVTPERLAAAAETWAPRFAHLPRPLVAVLVGGTNGRFRLDEPVGRSWPPSLQG